MQKKLFMAGDLFLNRAKSIFLQHSGVILILGVIRYYEVLPDYARLSITLHTTTFFE